MQSTYDGDPRFARARSRRTTPTPPAPPAREFCYVEPSRKARREGFEGQRSGLAYAAGYAGLAYLFRYSAQTVLITTIGLNSVALMLTFAWGLCAPLALVLGLRAGQRLDCTHGLQGRLPALTGFTVGLVGTINLCVELLTWLWVSK